MNVVSNEEKDYWKLDKNEYVLYTTNENIKELALASGLKVMAYYYSKDGKLEAMQFIGDKKTVINLAKRRVPFKPFRCRGKLFL